MYLSSFKKKKHVPGTGYDVKLAKGKAGGVCVELVSKVYLVLVHDGQEMPDMYKPIY